MILRIADEGDEAAIGALERLVDSDPQRALHALSRFRDNAPPNVTRVRALRARARAAMLLRRPEDAVTDLRSALKLLEGLDNSGDIGVAVTISLAAALDYCGRSPEAIELLQLMDDPSASELRSRRDAQLALLLHRSGRIDEAEALWATALDHDQLEPVFRADVLNNRGVARGYSGRFELARLDFLTAESIYELRDVHHAQADVLQNRGWLATQLGDFPEALRLFGRGDAMYESIGERAEARYPDECEALMAVGLYTEAAARAQESARALARNNDAADALEVFVLAARASLAGGRFTDARKSAERAVHMASEQRRTVWLVRSRLLLALVELGIAPGEVSVVGVGLVAEELAEAGMPTQALTARLEAGLVAARLGSIDLAEQMTQSYRRSRLSRIHRAHLEAIGSIVALHRGELRRASVLARRSASAIDDMRGMFHDPEFRLRSAQQAWGLAEVSIDIARRSERVWNEVRAVERFRAVSLRLPPVRPSHDSELDRCRRDLRDQVSWMHSAASAHEMGDAITAIRRAEIEVMRHSRRAEAATGPGLPSHPTLREIRRALGTRVGVMYWEHRGELHAVCIGRHPLRRLDLGPVVAVEREASALTRTLARMLLALAQGGSDTRLVARFAEESHRLERLLIHPLELAESQNDIVIWPTAAMQTIPWAGMPRLRRASIVVAPSLTTWLSKQHPVGLLRSVVVVAGPRLPFAAVEVRAIANQHPHPMCTVTMPRRIDDVVAASAGADMVHLVCHGTVNHENQRFSYVQLEDGPMYVHDFERSVPAPKVIVLSTCSLAAGTPVAGSELSGVVPSLLATNVRNVVAASVPIPDMPEAIDLMAAFHRRIAQADEPATAFASARRTLDEPTRPIGWAFNVYGG